MCMSFIQKRTMSPSRVHLITFVLVTVLCVCMATAVSPQLKSEDHKEESTSVTTHETGTTATSTQTSEAIWKNNTTSSGTTSPIYITSTISTGPENHTVPSHVTSLSSVNTTSMGPGAVKTTTTGSTSTGSTSTGSTTTGSTTKGIQSNDVLSGTGSGSKEAGIFFLIFIIFVIVILVVVLHILWKKGKRYSFDLTNGEHDTPLQSVEPMGTFEQTKGSTINLDCIQEDSNNRISPVANGCSGDVPEQTPCSEQASAPDEDKFPSDLSLDSPVKKVEFNLNLELIGGEPEPVKQATDESTDNDNENNNNDTNTGNDSAERFTEINLDDAQ